MAATLTLKEIAQQIGRSYNWMARGANRDALYAKGFPRPMNIAGRPTWDAQIVFAWKAAQQSAPDDVHSSAPIHINVTSLDKHKTNLAERLSA